METPETLYLDAESIDKAQNPNDTRYALLAYNFEPLHSIMYIRTDIVDDMLKVAEHHAYFAGYQKFREELLEWAYEDLDPAAYLQLKDKLNEM